MLYLDDREKKALEATLVPIAEIMGEFGWHRALNSLSRHEVLTLSEAIIEAYQNGRVELEISSRKRDPEIPF